MEAILSPRRGLRNPQSISAAALEPEENGPAVFCRDGNLLHISCETCLTGEHFDLAFGLLLHPMDRSQIGQDTLHSNPVVDSTGSIQFVPMSATAWRLPQQVCGPLRA